MWAVERPRSACNQLLAAGDLPQAIEPVQSPTAHAANLSMRANSVGERLGSVRRSATAAGMARRASSWSTRLSNGSITGRPMGTMVRSTPGPGRRTGEQGPGISYIEGRIAGGRFDQSMTIGPSEVIITLSG